MYVHVPYLSYSEDTQSLSVFISRAMWLNNLFPHITKTEGSPLSCICSYPCQGDFTIPRSLQWSHPATVLNQNSKQSFCVPFIYKCLHHFSLFDLIILSIQGEKHKSQVNTIFSIPHLLKYLSNISPKTKNHIIS